MKLLQYIYYKIFYMHNQGEDNSTAAGLAVMTISFIFFCNSMFIGVFFRKVDLITRFVHSVSEGVTLLVLFFVLNYFVFMHNKKYLTIKERFSNESRKNKIIGGLLVTIYGFLSFIAILILAFYKPGKW